MGNSMNHVRRRAERARALNKRNGAVQARAVLDCEQQIDRIRRQKAEKLRRYIDDGWGEREAVIAAELESIPYVSKHAQIRAEERVGRFPTPGEWAALTGAIRGINREPAVRLMRQNDGTEVWLVRLIGFPVKVAWSPGGSVVLTVLPSDAGLLPMAVRRQTFSTVLRRDVQ